MIGKKASAASDALQTGAGVLGPPEGCFQQKEKFGIDIFYASLHWQKI